MTKRIAVMVEGATERIFERALVDFLARRRAAIELPRLKFITKDGRIPKGELLKRDVQRLLTGHDDVIALTDVYTGSEPRDFEDALDAKQKMREWVGREPHFHPHAAQYEFEAWLLPYWDRVRSLSGSSRQVPSRSPESVNHNKPPSAFLDEAFRTGKQRAYRKILDGAAIPRDQDLAASARACPELKAFLNTILAICGGAPL